MVRQVISAAGCIVLFAATPGCMVQNHTNGPNSQSMTTLGEVVGVTFTSTTAGTKTTFDVGVVFGLWAPFGSWPVPSPPNPRAWSNAGL